MAKCQKCGSSIEGDFGFVSCPSCGEVNILDDVNNGSKSQPDLQIETSTQNKGRKSPPEESPVPFTEQEFAEVTPVPEPTPEPLAEVVSPEESQRPEVPAFAENVEAVLPTLEAPLAMDPMQEIADFGNSPESAADEGLLHYDIHIGGIDSKEQRDFLKMVMEDKKFNWNASDLLKGISQGILIIKNVNAVKASVLIRNLKGQHFAITWKQHAIME